MPLSIYCIEYQWLAHKGVKLLAMIKVNKLGRLRIPTQNGHFV